MPTYRIEILPCERFGNPKFENILSLNDEQLDGIVAMGTALFGIDRDDYLKICLDDEQIISLDKLLDESDVIVYEGESVEVLEPIGGEDWLNVVEETGDEYGEDRSVTQKYSVKTDPKSESERCCLFQFDEWDFIRGAYGLCGWMGLNPKDHLKYLHRGNEVRELP